MNNEMIAIAIATAKLAASSSKSSLDSLVKAKTRRSLLLVDCSGSMGEFIAAGGRKIDALRKVVADLRATHSTPVAAFGLRGRQVEVVDTVPEPAGGTPLHLAIDFGRTEGANHLVVVTDGEPDSEEAAFTAAREFGGQIDVFYIGNGGETYGSRFAAELARMTGGVAHLTSHADLGKPKVLAGEIRLMLGDGSDSLLVPRGEADRGRPFRREPQNKETT